MSHRAVYDTMIFFQWAVLARDRQHRTIKSLSDGSIRLCLSPATVDEARDVLTRPELQDRFPALTPERVDTVLLKLVTEPPDDAQRLRTLAPDLQIVAPAQLAEKLRQHEAQQGPIE